MSTGEELKFDVPWDRDIPPASRVVLTQIAKRMAMGFTGQIIIDCYGGIIKKASQRTDLK